VPAVWGQITAGEVLSPISGTWLSGEKRTVLKGLCTDSRKIRQGELFWALCGERYDGHDFIEKAVDKGASAIVVQRDIWETKAQTNKVSKSGFRVSPVITVEDSLKALGDLAGWWRHQHKVRVVAITGSTGKTTTKEMVAGILELGNRTLKSHGNFNNLVGLPVTLLQLEEGQRNAVLEMGMNRPGEIARLTEIADPDVGVITNVGMAHLEGVGDLNGVAKAKVELVEKISSTGKVVLNGDDELLVKTASVFPKKAVTYGMQGKNDVRAAQIKDLGRGGLSFDLQYQGDSWRVRLRSPGLQNVLNALAAAAASLCLNESPEHIIEGLGLFSGVNGRFAVTSLAGDIILVDDTYNANPSSLKAALDSVESLVPEGGRIIVGMGDMMELGESTLHEHQQAGRMVAELGPSYFVAMGDYAHEMTKAAVYSGMPRDRAEVVKTHKEMEGRIIEETRKGDLILLKASRKMGLESVVEGLKKTLS
jgi:UDP-N-acetylmuramoyl-tripeptide--D-alanyl-D-alanine ligase